VVLTLDEGGIADEAGPYFARQHDITTQKTLIVIFTSVKPQPPKSYTLTQNLEGRMKTRKYLSEYPVCAKIWTRGFPKTKQQCCLHGSSAFVC